MCLTCDANWRKWVKGNDNDGYNLMVDKDVGDRVVKNCFQMINETELSGSYYVQTLKMIDLSS